MSRGGKTDTERAESSVTRKRQVWNAMPNEAQENITELVREFHGDKGPDSIHLKAGDLEYRKRGGK